MYFTFVIVIKLFSELFLSDLPRSVMDLVCTPAISSTTTATSAVDDKDTEWRTTLQFVRTGTKLRTEKNCLFCGKPYKGGPDMIRAHLLSEVKPRSVGPACQPKAQYQQEYKEVCVILRRRIQETKHKEANQIKAVKNTTDISSVFNMSESDS